MPGTRTRARRARTRAARGPAPRAYAAWAIGLILLGVGSGTGPSVRPAGSGPPIPGATAPAIRTADSPAPARIGGGPAGPDPAGCSGASAPQNAAGCPASPKSRPAEFLDPADGGWLNLSPVGPMPPLTDLNLVYDGPQDPVTLVCLAECSGVWVLSGNAWQLHAESSSPPGRVEECLAWDPADGYAVLFGGFGEYSSPLGDTWILQNATWTNITSWSASAPSPRDDAAFAYDATTGSMILYGGFGPNDVQLNDTWSFYDGNWTLLSTNRTPPGGGSAAAGDPNDDGVVLLSEPNSSAPVTTWLFENGTWAPVRSALEPNYTFPMVWDPAYDAAILFAPNATGALWVWVFDAGGWGVVATAARPVGELLALSAEYVAAYSRIDVVIEPNSDGYLATPLTTWAFGSAFATLGPVPAGAGVIGVGRFVLSGPQTVETGLGTYDVFERANTGRVFVGWDASGNVSVVPASAGFYVLTIFGNGTLFAEFVRFPVVTLLAAPAYCGPIVVDGAPYPSPSSILLANGSHTLDDPGCAGNLTFGGWTATGNVSVAASSVAATTLFVRGNGTVGALFLAAVTVRVAPAAFGSVRIDGSEYGNGSVVGLSIGNHTLEPVNEPWTAFLTWTLEGGASLHGTELIVQAAATVAASFRLVPYATFSTDPANCGAISVNGTAPRTGIGLPVGGVAPTPVPEPIRAPDCQDQGELFARWAPSANLSVSDPFDANATLTATGNGTLEAVFVRGFLVSWIAASPGPTGLLLNGSLVRPGESLLLAAGTYSLAAEYPSNGPPPPGNWTTTGGVRVDGGSLVVDGPGSLAWRAPSSGSGGGAFQSPAIAAGIALAVVGVAGAIAWLGYLRARSRRRG